MIGINPLINTYPLKIIIFLEKKNLQVTMDNSKLKQAFIEAFPNQLDHVKITFNNRFVRSTEFISSTIKDCHRMKF